MPQDLPGRSIITAQRNEPEATSADAISAAARQISETLKLAAIVCYTGSGSTGIRVSRERPDVPIIALTPNPATGRRLAVVWGLHCVLTEDATDLNDMVERACRLAFKDGFTRAGQRVIMYLLSQPREDGDMRFPFNKSIIASKLGLTPETLSRLLHQLTDAGLISVEGKRVHIPDPVALESRIYEGSNGRDLARIA